jgi:very-short-patch-repair endonuclease
MSLKYNKKLIPRAKKLRRNMMPQESHLWYDFLSKYPIRFQRQKTIGNFIVDFYCHKAKLVVEVDGGQHYTDEGLGYDRERTAILGGYGLRVIRFSNVDVDRNFRGVCRVIDDTVVGVLSGLCHRKVRPQSPVAVSHHQKPLPQSPAGVSLHQKALPQSPAAVSLHQKALPRSPVGV